jgi:Polyketide cyclase / dehydrase and lipid transport
MTAPSPSRRRQDRNDRPNGHGNGNGNGNGKGSPAKKSQSGSRSSLAKNKHIIEESISVGVPHQDAYDQWTQYRDWSKIFKKESAEQKDEQDDKSRNGGGSDHGEDDNELSVTSKIGPSQRQWQAEVVAQEPGRRIEWEAQGGVQAKGVVTFHRLDDRLTHVQVVIHYVPSGFMETVGNTLRMPRRRVRKDLKLFKNFVDLRKEPTGEGPGRIRNGGLRQGVDQELRQAERSSEDDETRSR